LKAFQKVRRRVCRKVSFTATKVNNSMLPYAITFKFQWVNSKKYGSWLEKRRKIVRCLGGSIPSSVDNDTLVLCVAIKCFWLWLAVWMCSHRIDLRRRHLAHLHVYAVTFSLCLNRTSMYFDANYILGQMQTEFNYR
jgi:hypothetical protein